jgi:hypothetical protein
MNACLSFLANSKFKQAQTTSKKMEINEQQHKTLNQKDKKSYLQNIIDYTTLPFYIKKSLI